MSSFLLAKDGHISHGSFTSCFQEEKRKVRVSLSSAVFKMSLTQNNPYAKVTYFGIAFLIFYRTNDEMKVTYVSE
jgi:hypothetical protein